MQRRQTDLNGRLQSLRNISAHAEKTALKLMIDALAKKHLCACREDITR